MATNPKISNKRMAVLVYDGQDWSAFCFHGPIMRSLREAGSENSVPPGLMNFLREQRIKTIRVLLAGAVYRLEISLPPKLSFADVSNLLANEVADQTGTDALNLVCAGGSAAMLGVSDPCLLCGAFERQQIDSLHQQVTSAGLKFDGVGSLELAVAAYWNANRKRDTETLIVFGRDHGFILPARTLPDQPGPVSLSGGTRQIKRDPDAWQTRFIRGNRYLVTGGSPSVFAPGADPQKLATILGSIDGFPLPDFPEAEKMLEEAATQAAIGQSNQFSTPVPIRNPHVLRKRFSHAFIVVPCLFILLTSLLFPYGLAKLNYVVKRANYQEIVNTYGPIERQIEAAERDKTEIQSRLASAVTLQKNLADRRKPLFGFIHLTYFFSKYAGDTVRLESISDNGGVIEVRGIYTDPEEGLALKAALNEFAADKNLRILRNKVAEQENSEGRVYLTLELAVDYRELIK